MIDQNGEEGHPALDIAPDEQSTHQTPESRERFVVLLRHGIAEDPTESKPDSERALTPRGQARMRQNLRGLAKAFPQAEVVISSPLLRSVQTAMLVLKAYKDRIEFRTSEALSPNANPSDLESLLARTTNRSIILVGHEPNLTRATFSLIGMNGANLELRKGGCYGVQFDAAGNAQLEWLLSPRVLRRIQV